MGQEVRESERKGNRKQAGRRGRWGLGPDTCYSVGLGHGPSFGGLVAKQRWVLTKGYEPIIGAWQPRKDVYCLVWNSEKGLTGMHWKQYSNITLGEKVHKKGEGSGSL